MVNVNGATRSSGSREPLTVITWAISPAALEFQFNIFPISLNLNFDSTFYRYIYFAHQKNASRYLSRFLCRCSDVILEVQKEGAEWKDVRLGSFGMLHPEVLKAYELRDPSSAVEMDLEPLM